MNIGTAIKTLRKHKGFSQKDLSQAVGISQNALSLIEANVTFPQKNTIKSICEKLGIPESYLLFFSLSEDDVPIEKRSAFISLNDAMKAFLLSDSVKK